MLDCLLVPPKCSTVSGWVSRNHLPSICHWILIPLRSLYGPKERGKLVVDVIRPLQPYLCCLITSLTEARGVWILPQFPLRVHYTSTLKECRVGRAAEECFVVTLVCQAVGCPFCARCCAMYCLHISLLFFWSHYWTLNMRCCVWY